MKKPNLLIFVSDHFRAEALHHLGNVASITPNLDVLSKEGVSFAHAFCQNPVCVPSRCSFLSGNYPHVNGFRTMHHLQTKEDGNILRELKKNGYHIYFGGKNDVFNKAIPLTDYCDDRSDAYSEASCLANGTNLPEGYRSILHTYRQVDAKKAMDLKEQCRGDEDSLNYYAMFQGVVDSTNHLEIGSMGAEDAQILDAIRYINEYQGEQPLCIYLSCLLPHPHYAATPQDYEAIDPTLIEPCVRLNQDQLSLKPSIMQGMRTNQRLNQWENEALLAFKRTYLAMVHHVDENFGKLIDALKQKEIYDDTGIFMFSDHGDYAGEFEIVEINQNTFEDVLTNVPLLIKPPKQIEYTTGISEALVELVDIPATIAEFCDITLSYPQFGKSLVPVLKGANKHRPYVYCEGGRRVDETHCMDDGHPKTNTYWSRTNEQTKIPEHTKAIMIRNHLFKYVKRLYELDEFYDLKKDPKEKENLIQSSEYQTVITQMKEELLNFMIETCDQVPFHYDER